MAKEWTTNDTEVAAKLRKADADYEELVRKADALPLMQKVLAIQKARAIRDARYKLATGKI